MLLAFKIILVAVLAFILFSLGQALVWMLKDHDGSGRALDALKRRVGLSVLLFALMLIGVAAGIIPIKQNPLQLSPKPAAADAPAAPALPDD